MKVKEPLVRYNAMPSVAVMRGRLLKAIENEEDINFIQNMYVMMLKMSNDTKNEKKGKYSLSELKGILTTDNNKSYSDMREEYLKVKYSV